MKIAVSGIGLVTPLGLSREETWRRLVAGDTALTLGSQGLESPVMDFSANGARSRTGDFAVWAAKEALQHAGIDSGMIKNTQIGCAISQSKPILSGHSDVCFPPNNEASIQSQSSACKTQNGTPAYSNATGLDPALILASFLGWSTESVVQRELNLNGPTANVAAACATGIASIETGARWIRSGQCEVALVGASEASLNPLYRAGFEQMGVLAKGDTPLAACPFNKNRSGFVMGEGAAVLVLESDLSLMKRGKKPLAMLLNARLRHSSCDSLRFDPDGTSIAHLIESLLSGFSIPGYINAHGTGTLFNDAVETRGIKQALKSKSMFVPVSSTKAATGHLLGAAGAVEAAFCVLAIRDGQLPPTLHLNSPDPECDLDYIPNRSRHQKISSALSLSYGFGGQMGAVFFGSC